MNKRKTGKTGKFPKGKISADDEGELALGVANDGENVILDFGTPTKWIGMPADQAIQFATLIAKHAGKIKGVIVTISISEPSSARDSDASNSPTTGH